jgi:hypothetical protein
VHDEEPTVGKREHQALPDPIDGADRSAEDGLEWRIDRTQHERAQNLNAIETAAEDVAPQCLDVDDEVGKFRQASCTSSKG